MKKIIPKVLAIAGIVCVLVSCFVVPSFAYSYVGEGSQPYDTTFLNGYTATYADPDVISAGTYDGVYRAHVALNSAEGHFEGWRYTDFVMESGWDRASEYRGSYRQRQRSNGLVDTIVEYSSFDLFDSANSDAWYYLRDYELHFNPLSFSGDADYDDYQYYPEHFELSNRVGFSDAFLYLEATLEAPYMFVYVDNDQYFINTNVLELDIQVHERLGGGEDGVGGQSFPFDDPDDITLTFTNPNTYRRESYSWSDYFVTYDTVDSFTRFVIDNAFVAVDEYIGSISDDRIYDLVTPFDVDKWCFNFTIDHCYFEVTDPLLTDDLGNYLNNSCAFSCTTSVEDNDVDYNFVDFYHSVPRIINIVQEVVDVDPFGWLLEAGDALLSTEIFPGFSFGLILIIGLCVPALIGILKMIAGG